MNFLKSALVDTCLKEQVSNIKNIKTNASGFVAFENRDFGYRGDKGTWAKMDGKKITVCKAANGTISRAYETEISDFCEKFGIDFSAMRSGTRVTVEIG